MLISPAPRFPPCAIETPVLGRAESKYVHSWEQAFELGPAEVGGKAWSIAALRRYGFSTPNGFVISATLADEVISSAAVSRAIGQLPPPQERDVGNQIIHEKLAAVTAAICAHELSPVAQFEIQRALLDSCLAETACVVRSSGLMEDGAAFSFAGIHESYLNVSGWEDIAKAVLRCMASPWLDKAVAYRRQFNLSDDGARLCVLVMPLVDADAGGVVFCALPATGSRDTAVITASLGLPASVVNGESQCDRYVVDTASLFCHSHSADIAHQTHATRPATDGGVENVALAYGTGKRAVLSNAERLRLVEQSLQIQSALATGDDPYDIEWAKIGGNFVFLQARPITAVEYGTRVPSGKLPPLWSTANLKDASPGVQTPLGSDLMRVVLRDILVTPFRLVGYRAAATICFSKLFFGRPYLNMAALQWIYYDAFGIPPRDLNNAIGGYQGELFDPNRMLVGLRTGAVRFARRIVLIAAVIGSAVYFSLANKSMARAAAKAGQQVSNTVTNGQLLEFIGRQAKSIKRAGALFQLMNSFAGAAHSLLLLMLRRAGIDAPDAVALRLMAGAGGVASAVYTEHLWDLAEVLKGDPVLSRVATSPIGAADLRQILATLPDDHPFRLRFSAFLEEFGHRGVYEMEIANPRWAEDPTFLLENVLLLSKEQRLRQPAPQVADQVMTELGLNSRCLTGLALRLLAGCARHGVRLRENAKSLLVRVAQPMRIGFLEIGERLVKQGKLDTADDVFYCSWWELLDVLRDGGDKRPLGLLVGERKTRRSGWTAVQPPDLLGAVAPLTLAPHATASTGKRFPIKGRQRKLQGVGVSFGVVEGVARVISHPDQCGRLESGEILIAATSDPAWAPLFFRASAVVLEMGGLLSHGAILARELGIPSVANVRDLLDHISDGDLIRVDGERGLVSILS